MRTNDKPYGIEEFIAAEVTARLRKIEKISDRCARARSSVHVALSFPSVIYTCRTIKMNVQQYTTPRAS